MELGEGSCVPSTFQLSGHLSGRERHSVPRLPLVSSSQGQWNPGRGFEHRGAWLYRIPKDTQCQCPGHPSFFPQVVEAGPELLGPSQR